MLERTFCHLPGIGPKKESQLWEAGIDTWGKFLSGDHPYGHLKPLIVQSAESLAKKDVSFFAESLPSDERWRLYEAFGENAAFVDIETTGLSQDYNEITLIGLYDKNGHQTFINGQNIGGFKNAIQGYSLIATFNGVLFDLPFIKAKYPDITLPPAHIDLRFTLRKLGYRGGLKKIEANLGIVRPEETQGLNGYAAVILWEKYRMGDKKALEKLIRYNQEDTANLKTLMEIAYPRLTESLS